MPKGDMTVHLEDISKTINNIQSIDEFIRYTNGPVSFTDKVSEWIPNLPLKPYTQGHGGKLFKQAVHRKLRDPEFTPRAVRKMHLI